MISIAILALLALPGTDLAIIALLPALVVGLTENGSVTVKALSRPIIYWLGEVSYSIYLVHRLIESIAEQPLRKIFSSELAVGLVMAAATIGLAAITFYGIEKPCRGISRRVFTSRKPRAAHG